MNNKLPVAVDAMGGDNAPFAVVKGAIAVAKNSGLGSILVGDESKINVLLDRFQAEDLVASGLIQVSHASETIGMDEKPTLALRRKKNSSMHEACRLVKEQKASGALSAGNSGAMMSVSLLTLGRLEGVLRPAIAALFPSKKGFSIVLDVGANTECTPVYMFQFALMGYAYSNAILKVKNSTIGVLSNGEERSKGTDLTRDTLELIVKSGLPNKGHVEGRDIYSGEVDVIICDGFTGNLVLKAAEGTASFLMGLIKESFTHASLKEKIGGFLSRPLFQKVKKKVDPREFGAAPLLGLTAPVYIAHGGSDAYAIEHAIRRVHRQSDQDVAKLIEKLIFDFRSISA